MNGGAPLALGVTDSVFAQAASSNQAFQSGFKNGATLADLEGAVPGFSPPSYNTMGSKVLNPKFLEWNFEIERELVKNYSLGAIQLHLEPWHGHVFQQLFATVRLQYDWEH